MASPAGILFLRSIIVAAAFCAPVCSARAEALLLIEADTGKVLHAVNATHPWYPASVTKLMTVYLTLKAVKEKRITLDTLFTVSPAAAAQQPSKMGFPAGTQVTVDNALKMLMVKSANDMAVVLAEGLSGSVEEFAVAMNRASEQLGMTQSHWVNPNGLPDDRQVSSARDLAILARALLQEFPEYDGYWRIPAIKLGKRVMRNYNTLIGRYPGADGMKTGFICASGFNLVATATRGNKRLIAVVLGAPSAPVRAARAAQLLEYGFNSQGFSWLTPALGTLDTLTLVNNAAPPDLREEMCGKHRRRPAAEEADGTEPSGSGADAERTFLLSSLNGLMPKPSTLLSQTTVSAPPVVVFVGPPKRNTTLAGASPPIDASRTASRRLVPLPPTRPKIAIIKRPKETPANKPRVAQ